MAPATATSTDTIPNALFFFVPLFSLIIAVLAVTNSARQSRGPNAHIGTAAPANRRQAHVAYAFIALLALLSTLAGALPFIRASTGNSAKAEAVVQALLLSLLGVPVFHLAAYYDNRDDDNDAPLKSRTRRHIFETVYSSILVITLTGATLTTLLQQLLPSSSAAALGRQSPLYFLPHALYLLYALLALRRIACVLFRFLYPSSPSFFSYSCFSSFLHPSSSSRIRRGFARSTTGRPITIHISTQRTSAPFSEASSSLSCPASPSSAASFPCPLSGIEQPQRAIQLALPKRKDKDTRSRLIDTDIRCVLYQDELKRKSAGGLDSDSNLIAIDKHRHRYRPKKSSSTSSSIDSTSTTSTITAIDHSRQDRSAGNTLTSATVALSARRPLTPPLSSFPSITPPRAAYTPTPDTPLAPLLAAATISGVRQRGTEGRLYTFPFPFTSDDPNLSASTESTDDPSGIPLGVSSTVSVTADNSDSQLGDWIYGGSGDSNSSLRTRLAYSRATRRLLVILAAVQVTLIIGYACRIGEDIPSRLESSTFASSASTPSPLRIVQAVCTVLAVTGTMSAYLLHAYNTHLSPSRSRSAAKSKSNPNPTTASASSATPRTPYYHNHYNNNNNSNLTTSGVNIQVSSSSVVQIAETNTRPVLIQLAPPPPPRTRRKRVDAFAMSGPLGAGAADTGEGVGESGMTSFSMREREREWSRMDVPRSVSLSVAGTTSGFGSSVRYSGEVDDDEGDRVRLGDALDGLDPYSYSNPNSNEYRYQHYQHHLGYDGTPFEDHTASALHYDPTAAYNERRISQPVILTYEPPVMSGGLSLLETSETEGENGGDDDLEFDDVVDEDDYELDVDDRDGGMYMEDMEEDLDLENEMQKALSRSSSMATSTSGLSRGGGHGRTGSMTMKKRRVGSANAASGAVKGKAVPIKPKPMTKPKSKAKKAMMEDPATYIRKRGSMPVAPSTTKRLFGWEFGWDPVPIPSVGAGAGTSASASAKGRRQSVGAVKKRRDAMNEREVERTQESSFMDLKGAGGASATVAVAVGVTTRKLKRHSTPAGSTYARSVIGGGATAGTMKKQEKWEEVVGLGMTHTPGVVPAKGEKENGMASAGMVAAGMRKLKKKRSQSATRPGASEDVVVSPARAGFFPGLPSATSSNPGSATLAHSASLNSNLKTPLSANTKSSSRPGTADSGQGSHGGSSHASKPSLGSGSSIRRGLQLKRSFKLSVGRTLGPGLTLASAGTVGGRQEWEAKGLERGQEEDHARRTRRSDESAQTGDYEEEADVDVDGEIRSIAAARLVSASIARVTPAATIVTAPSVGIRTPPPPSAYYSQPKSSPVDIAYPSLSPSSSKVQATTRPTLPAIVTAPIPIPTANVIPFPLSAPAPRRPANGFSPVVQSPGNQQPHTSGSTWMPHPFADPLEQPMPNVSSVTPYMISGCDGGSTMSVDDDVVQLEREMEEIRGRRAEGGDAMDSPTTQFRELAAMAAAQAGTLSASVPSQSPGLSSSMTPSLTSMFALAHAQAQTAAPPPPPPPVEKEKSLLKLFGGGHFQKRLALSSPPVAKSDWGPQSSVVAGGSAGGGFLYRFPMIFPNSFTGSPPRPSTVVNGGGSQQSNVAVPRPNSPRGGSALRLSAMETVRNTFASVGAKMSSATSRMSVTSSAGASLRNGGGHGFGEMIMEDIDGDFMDLRDPFASPPPASNIATVVIPAAATTTSKKSSGKSRGGDGDRERSNAEDAEMLKRKMSTWGKLPMPARSFSPAPGGSAVGGIGNAASVASVPKRHSLVNGRPVARVVGKPSPVHHRKHKKERRSRKPTLPSMAAAMGPLKVGSPEDADFGLEEALLSQRLLNRLDSDDWESRV